jgi:hypothetical protein
MSLGDAARRAREHAQVCVNPACHRVALALEAALKAAKWRHDRDHDLSGRTDDIPPWSQISRPGTSEGPLPFH